MKIKNLLVVKYPDGYYHIQYIGHNMKKLTKIKNDEDARVFKDKLNAYLKTIPENDPALLKVEYLQHVFSKTPFILEAM